MGRTHDITISGFDLDKIEAELKSTMAENARLREELVEARNHEYAGELKAAHDETYALRGSLARLCRAVCRRMMPDKPTPDDLMELLEAYDWACDTLERG